MPTTPSRETLKQLLSIQRKPCLTLYQPTHRTFPDREQDPIRYKHLVRQLEDALQQQGGGETETLLAPFLALQDDPTFWNNSREGLAIFGAPGYFEVFRLLRRVPELAVANDRMHVKPLLRLAQSADRYQILALTLDAVHLYEGTRDGISEVPLAPAVPATLEDALGHELTGKDQSGLPQGFSRASERGDAMQSEAGGSGRQSEIDRDRERFFREVDRTLLEYHSRPSGLPLLLAALPEHQFVFRKLSHNPHLLETGIEKDPALLSRDDLRQLSWAAMEPRYVQRLTGLLDQYGEAHGQGRATDQLADIGPAIVAGRVATLLVEAERQIPGRADRESGTVDSAATDSASTPDLLDELAVWTLEYGGDVVVVPRERMPATTGVAALYRY